jgi:hypothetical protein
MGVDDDDDDDRNSVLTVQEAALQLGCYIGNGAVKLK